uniref:Uncharacterized protein n=1 Tax=Setaria italica TaxID=4555 RepID=K3ZCN4_SETIT
MVAMGSGMFVQCNLCFVHGEVVVFRF